MSRGSLNQACALGCGCGVAKARCHTDTDVRLGRAQPTTWSKRGAKDKLYNTEETQHGPSNFPRQLCRDGLSALGLCFRLWRWLRRGQHFVRETADRHTGKLGTTLDCLVRGRRARTVGGRHAPGL